MSDNPQAVGYIVLTKGLDGAWHDDWDAQVHPDLAHGADAVREAREDGGDAILVGCYPIHENHIRDTTAGGERNGLSDRKPRPDSHSTWFKGEMLALARGCDPSNDCWMDCMEAARDTVVEGLDEDEKRMIHNMAKRYYPPGGSKGRR